MSLSSDEKRSLDRIEASLRLSDPALAAMHDEFTRRRTAGSIPGIDQASTRSRPGIDAVGSAPRYRRLVRPLIAALLVTLLILAIVGAVKDASKMRWPARRCATSAQNSTCHQKARATNTKSGRTGAGPHG